MKVAATRVFNHLEMARRMQRTPLGKLPMRLATWTSVLLGAALAAPLAGATLEKLSLEEMVRKSTSIVRVRAEGSRTVQRGLLIYTLTRVTVIERWKGPERSSMEVAVPGGALGGLRQEFSGAPTLKPGAEYVLFLWTGKSGITHVIGLSQGVFELIRDANGKLVVHRPAASATMLDPGTGRPVQDQSLTLALSELRRRVDQAMGAATK